MVYAACKHAPGKKAWPLLSNLSERFGEAQYFGTHRIVEYHAWSRAVKGKIIRRFGYVGDRFEILCDEGIPTAEERSGGLVFNESKVPTEQDVMRLAGRWSIDPTTLEELNLGKSLGFLGSIGEGQNWR